jgi:cyclic-di-AMP phosphodiesterase PgpH
MFDFIKRARLMRQGMSCGKTRRKQSQSEFMDTIRCHPLVGLGAFILVFVSTLVLLQILARNLPGHTVGLNGIFTAAIFLTAAVHWYLGLPSKIRPNTTIVLTFSVILLHLVGIGLVLGFGLSRNWDTGYTLLLAPHALAPMLLGMLVGRRIGLFAAVYGTLLGATLVEDAHTLPFVATGLSIGFTAVFVTQKVRRRSRLLTSGLYIGAVAALYMIAFGQTAVAMSSDKQVLMLMAPFMCGLLTAMLAGAILPALESLFRVTTDISWLELADLNHPLMKRLSIEAPGTYHHCLVVANLAEAAAESIGANATMCRVASYFHDIGKLTKPEYFIENMNPEDNPHDDLTARMSALVLIAHVKDGVDLALKHGLNSRIIDVIEQHHGNSLVYFFYRRALDQKNEIIRLVEQDKAREDDVPEVTEDGFRYPGPRPQGKEAAVISLADAVESASRTLVKPTPARVEQLVEDIVRNRILDHQLDECDLTMADLTEMKASFVKTLLSMLHSRIHYPKAPTERTPSEDVRKQAKETEQPAAASASKVGHAA